MSYTISDNDKDKILNNIHIEDVIGKAVNLKKAGINKVGLCPFHADRTASMYVSPAKQIFKCFACGEGGNVIHFVMKNEGLSFPEACKQLAKDHNIDITIGELSPEEKQKEQLRESVGIVLTEAQNQFEENITHSPDAISYLKEKRGLTDEIIKLYGAGFARSDNQFTRDFTGKGYKFEILQAAGLVKVKEETGYRFDNFFNRIMFPYYNLSGKIVGFTGRILEDKEDAPKYYNSPDTILFNKGEQLFGLHQAKKNISRTEKAYFVEGQFDVISFVQNGIKNTVCGSGTALTDSQAKLLHRFANTVVLIYDKDEAGAKAAIRSIRIFLAYGLEVRGVILPDGEDPDSFACKNTGDKLSKVISEMEQDFLVYAYDLLKKTAGSAFDEMKVLDQLCECVAVIPDLVLRERYIKKLADLFNTNPSNIAERVKPKKELKVDVWKDGFYGVDEAAELLSDEDSDELCVLTFDQEEFIDLFSDEYPVIYVSGNPTVSDIQLLRSRINKLKVQEDIMVNPTEKDEPRGLEILKQLFKEGIDISMFYTDPADENKKIVYRVFCDFYVSKYGNIIKKDVTGIIKELATERCLDVIADSSEVSRNMMMASYAGYMGVAKGALEKLLKPRLAKKKNKIDFESQRIDAYANMIPLDSQNLPDYVRNNELMKEEYERSQYFPWLDVDNRAAAYVFKNQNGSGFTVLSDFYIQPLLHVTDDMGGNKRVVKLSHIQKKYDKYVELPSNMFASLQTLNVKLVEEGPYNFDGSAYQYKRVWRNISYGFTPCTELKIFGQQPEGFFAFSNAILHQVSGNYQLDYNDDLGVVSHNGDNFYSPAFSKIHLKSRNENDAYKQSRNIMYKDIPAEKRLTFSQWAKLMDDVYCINNNGKWGVLFAITSAFRDFIFKERAFFTALFFIGPTGSGKTQIAESIRNLFMDSKTPSFNLNTGTDAAFFMLLENFRNVIVAMEEYNDKDISPTKFQGLKSATLDGEGKIKVKDIGSKTMDSSVINASLIILGQEASQQDDGALSNRCIICDVPYRPSGEFSEEETNIYLQLKEHERIGLCNILVDILKIRPLFEKYYLQILSEESKRIKDAVKVELTNTEGLSRIINAAALMASTCKLLEKHVPEMKLPFSYEEFFKLACDKVLSQLDRISSSNKLAVYFKAISTLITERSVMIGRELKIIETNKVTVKLSGSKTEQKDFDNPMKVLFLDFSELHTKYKRIVGEKEALTEASLRSYFNSCKAYIGLCKATQFKWDEPMHDFTGGFVPGGEDGMEGEINRRAQLTMVTKSKNTSAYMFNYEILKDLMDIDFERKDEVKKENGPELPF